MSHACISNVSQTFSKRPPYTSKCIASVDIKKDEEIFTSYLVSTVSTTSRHKKLKEFWYFECSCQRCADPSENESYVGAIICSKCKDNGTESISSFG